MKYDVVNKTINAEDIQFLNFRVHAHEIGDPQKQPMLIDINSVSPLVGAIAILDAEEGPNDIETALAESTLHIFKSLEERFEITQITHK